MKNILQIILITFFTFAISSCAKKDDSKTATAIPATGTGTTASGTISGAAQEWTGLYNMSWSGAEPSGGCIDNSTALSAYSSILPSGTVSFKNQKIITSSRSFTKMYSYYSTANCSTKTGHIKYNYRDLTIGSSVSGLTAGSEPTRPTSAYKVQYSKLNVISKGKTSTAVSFLNTFVGMTHSLDVEQTKPDSGTIYNIWATGTAGGVNLLFIGTESPSTYPTGWTSNDEISFK